MTLEYPSLYLGSYISFQAIAAAAPQVAPVPVAPIATPWRLPWVVISVAVFSAI